MMRDHGSEKRYYHEILGWNGRLDELQAAVLKIKLPYLDDWNDQRRQIASFYNQSLSKFELITPRESADNRHVYHLYVVRSPIREQLRAALADRNIGTGIHYPVPIHLQKAFREFGDQEGSLPVTEGVVAEILSLPIYPELTTEQANQVVEAIQTFYA
jgi:dTDP-4-amino-4,6-dideoxygalactose transaminase